jgi:AraC-like DNA-binding protein/mannose-6-phosphate isomerase-like protein (cupin superfamily)
LAHSAIAANGPRVAFPWICDYSAEMVPLKLRRIPVPVSLPPFGISAFTSRHAADFRMPEVSHSFDKLCFVEAGSGVLDYGTGVLNLEAGSLLLVPAHTSHRFVDCVKAPMTLSVLCINQQVMASPDDRDLWRQVASHLPMGRRVAVSNVYFEGEVLRLFRSIILELGQERVGRNAMIHSLTVQLLVLIRRIIEEQLASPQLQPSHGFLSSVAEIDDRFAQALKIKDLAQRAGMCYRSYTESFRRYKGMTVTQYITQRRLEFSQRRMLETGDIMGSALASGFHDLGHFYRIFKRHIGRTPLEYIRLNRGESV